MNDGRWGEGLSASAGVVERPLSRHLHFYYITIFSCSAYIGPAPHHWVARMVLHQIERHKINIHSYLWRNEAEKVDPKQNFIIFSSPKY